MNEISPLTSETIAISHRSIPEFEESPRWVRAMFGGETIADSTRVMVLRRANQLPVYCFPREDVRMDLMEKTPHRSEFPPQGTATYWSIEVGDKMAENAAWGFLNPTDAWQTLKDYKQRWLARWVNAEVSFQLGPDGTSTIRRGPPNGMPPPDPDDFVWADEVPPFQPESMFIAPDGTAWVETVPGADGVVRYDVFDDAGQMVGQAELPPGHRVVGVGRASIFLVRIDNDGLEWLGRYGVEQH